MTSKILLCHCPDLPVDAGALAARLASLGIAAEIAPPLCTPAGLAHLQALLAQPQGDLLLAACGPERTAGIFSHLAEPGRLPVVDLLGISDLDAAAGLLTLALTSPPPAFRTAAPASREVLVVGGGIGGCQVALDLARAGIKVHLLDSSLSIGGTMAKLDKTFPTLDCSICILGPKLVEVATHPLIELLTFAYLTGIAGQAGRFQVDLTLKPRYVDLEKCVGCGSCTEACPVIVPSRWNLGLKPRKCIRIVFAQAVPLLATVEKEYCIDCRMCLQACEHQAIDLDTRPASRRLQVGAIVVATGAVPFDPAIKSEYGYGRLRRVIASLEFERLVCATGPTAGALVAPDGSPVRRLAFLQCVGSRDRRFLPYCSGICCTAAVKHAMLALEHQPETEITIFYNDLRTSGKGFEELYRRAQAAGVRFIKGLPGAIEEDQTGRPVIVYEDQHTSRRAALTVDLAVLAVGLAPPPGDLPFEEAGPARDALGFYQARTPILEPLTATVPGVFLVGTCQGPQDIAETVCQGSAAAARVITLLAELSG